jgi:phosphate transport system protein
MARQQPVAGDLRMTISILQIIRDLERIGDHCEDIAKYTLRFENKKFIKELVDIPRMAELAARMVNDSIDAFINKNLRLARKVWNKYSISIIINQELKHKRRWKKYKS